MLYIDFTSPEGTVYRIDVAQNPLIYECSVCGEKTVYSFDPDNANYCHPCSDRREKERIKKWEILFDITEMVNHKYKTYLTADDIEDIANNPEGDDPVRLEYSGKDKHAIRGFIEFLLEEQLGIKRPASRTHPKVTIIPPNQKTNK